MKMIRIILLACFIFGFSNTNLKAQKVYELQECVDIALINSLTLKQANLATQRAQIDEKQARSARYPNLNAGTNLNLNFGRSLDLTTNEYNTSQFLSNGLSLNSGILVYGGGRINNSIKQAKLEMAASRLDINQNEKDLSLQVAGAYLNVMYALENVEISKYQKVLSESQLTQLDKFIAVGSRPKNDRLDLEANLAVAEQNLVMASNNYETTMLNLKHIMNIKADTPMALSVPENEVQLVSDPDLLDYNQVFQNAMNSQPDIQAAAIRINSAEKGINIAKAGYYPSLSLGLSMGTNFSNQRKKIDGFATELVNSPVFINNIPAVLGVNQAIPLTSDNPYFSQLDENFYYGVGLNLNIPLYDNYSTKGAVERAKLNVIHNNIQKEQVIQNLRTNVQNALLDARAAKRQMEANVKNVDAQKVAYENAKRKFDLGAINTYDLVNIQNQYESSLVNKTIAKYNFIFKMKVLDFYQGIPLKF